MPEFLKLHSVAEAKELFWEHVKKLPIRGETIPTEDACSRYLFEAIISQEFLPPFTRSSMDGYAVLARDTQGSTENLPAYLKIIGEVPMGQLPQFAISSGGTALIHTGGMMPAGADAVVILEQSQITTHGELEVFQAVASGENVLFKGEDVKPGDIVIPAGKQLRPAEIGGLLALGQMQVKVAKKPVLAVLSSGDEVIPPQKTPEVGQIRDINSGMLAAQIKKAGGEVMTYPIISDQREQMETVVRQAYNNADAVIITAGSSASTRDMTSEVIKKLGEPGVLVHGINIRPGKPSILAICDGKPVIGLPGNPVSAMVIAHFFVEPLVRLMQGGNPELPDATVRAKLEVNISSQTGREDWVPVRLKKVGNEFIAQPIFFKSNLIFQLSNADGLIKIPMDANGIPAGMEVDVLFF